MKFRRRASATARKTLLDMTPFVDTFLNLMIFFFVTATFTEGGLSPKLDVNLPKSSSSVMGRAKEDLAIVIRPNGAIEVEGAAANLTSLEARLRRYVKEDPQGGVMIRADERVPHGRVVEVMGIVDRLQIKRLSIGVEATQ
jgi:biopolymer transport protein ExbD